MHGSTKSDSFYNTRDWIITSFIIVLLLLVFALAFKLYQTLGKLVAKDDAAVRGQELKETNNFSPNPYYESDQDQVVVIQGPQDVYENKHVQNPGTYYDY